MEAFIIMVSYYNKLVNIYPKISAHCTNNASRICLTEIKTEPSGDPEGSVRSYELKFIWLQQAHMTNRRLLCSKFYFYGYVFYLKSKEITSTVSPSPQLSVGMSVSLSNSRPSST